MIKRMDVKTEKIEFLDVPLVLRPEDIDEAHAALERLEKKKNNFVLILKAKNPEKFCLGMDLKYIKKHGIQAGVRLAQGLMTVTSRILDLNCPVIAVVNGHAIAGGMIIALCADYIIMSQDSGFLCMSEILLGLVIPSAATRLLKHKIRPDILRDLIIKAKPFKASEAVDCTLIDEALPSNKLMDRALQVASEYLENSEAHLNARRFRRESLGKTIEKCAVGEYDADFVKAMIVDGIKI